MPTEAELLERIDSLEALVHQALQRAMFHADEHGDEGSDPQRPRLAVQDEGSEVGRRPAVNFTGAGVTASDNAASDRVDVAITGGGSSQHNLLDGSVHPDTLAGTVLAGDLVTGNVTPKWERLAKGTANYVLKAGGAVL